MLPHYKSDITLFIEELKRKDPKLEEKQRAGWHLLWDKEQDYELLEQFKKGRVSQQPYVYETALQQPFTKKQKDPTKVL